MKDSLDYPEEDKDEDDILEDKDKNEDDVFAHSVMALEHPKEYSKAIKGACDEKKGTKSGLYGDIGE